MWFFKESSLNFRCVLMVGYNLCEMWTVSGSHPFAEAERFHQPSDVYFEVDYFWDAKYLEISSEREAEFSNILLALLGKQALYAPVSLGCLKK